MNTKQIALVTGANKGIGFEVARRLGMVGMTVLLGARSAELGEAAAVTLRNENLDVRFVEVDLVQAGTIAAAASLIAAEYERL
ncbi:MAG TPA: SDR family NAD(P)-dependent oxidoreductase, partial [Candidatus Binataceae bacterium]|nr:SDR family NAD(P)-dependent oxidoreductase [Candidatus Binataceae bacterium]